MDTLHLKAAEQMAGRARECQTTVTELFTHSYDFSFDTPGHSDAEIIQHAVDVTPELIERAESVLRSWSSR